MRLQAKKLPVSVMKLDKKYQIVLPVFLVCSQEEGYKRCVIEYCKIAPIDKLRL